MTFLGKVAQQIVDEHREGCDDVLVVFNNRRAGLFLQRELQKLCDRPFFLPRIIGIDDLVGELGGLRIVPHEFLLFELYDIHRSLTREPEPFEDFIALGEMMLGDFTEIDLYGIPADRILGNLYDLKKLGEWNLDEKQQTDFQKRYLEFYNSLHTYYKELHKRLEGRNEAYSGMAYRNLAEHIETMAGKLEEKNIYFVGFNALSRCESMIIKWFENQGIGRLICDGDDYYFSDTVQEAGHFLRQNAQRHKIDTRFGNNFAEGEKQIHIVNSPENVLQAKTAGAIIQKAGKGDWGSGSAIVLADEKLLIPMLNSLPSDIDAINVTMGLPFTMSGVHNMTCKTLALLANRHSGKFHHVDITNFFSDNIISRLLGTTAALSTVKDKLYADKTIYASADEIKAITRQIPNVEKIMFVFECDKGVEETLSVMKRLVSVVNESGCIETVVREQESLACLLQIVNYLEQIQEKYQHIQTIETLQRIYLRLASHHTIALYGEPLKEIQLLGVLETRNLDFERLIILSVNEGTLPSGRSSNSLIPYTLKRAFGLPTHEEKDAVYAYNFYRLIQRAREVWLIYSSDSEGMGKGEPSRFILQLRNEMASKNSNIKIDSFPVDVENRQQEKNTVDHAKKDERALQRLKEMAKRGFSPSALNRYRNCPMMFYLGDVVGVHETEELTEEVESNELGTFIHKLLCDIYSIDTDKRIRVETLSEALKKIPETAEEAFRSDVLKGRSDDGKNRLYLEVAKMEISHFLEREIKKLKEGHTIQMVLTDDKPITQPLPIGEPFADFPVNINGTTDRVDYYDGQLRVADYKSGGVKEDDLRMKKPILSLREPSDKWFQVMTYAWLYCRSSGYNGSFMTGIFPLRALSSDYIAATWFEAKTMDSTHIDQFEEILRDLITEILDPKADFLASPKKGTCDYCPFNKGCKRQDTGLATVRTTRKGDSQKEEL